MISTVERKGLIDRIKDRLGSFPNLLVRSSGPHVVIAEGANAAPVARVTALGEDQFGLSFPDRTGKWDMLLIDTLDGIVENVSVAVAA
jgi:hypothetical protein